MAIVVGVRFARQSKIYYFDPSEVWPRIGDGVIVDTSRGAEYGIVAMSAREVSDGHIQPPLRKVLRMATPDDVQRADALESRAKEAMEVCQDKIAAHNLDMKLIDTEVAFDGSKIVFFFTANGRIDFRELVKDLASVFKTRIELRQIGVRDEARMLGGLGPCGRPICCGAFLANFQPVSIKMAKEQGLSLNPTKISGLCGRLMCCLKYEQDYYEDTLKRLPKPGRDIQTPDGIGVVVEINALCEKVKARIRLEDGTFDVREYDCDAVSRPTAPRPVQPARYPSDAPAKSAWRNPDVAPDKAAPVVPVRPEYDPESELDDELEYEPESEPKLEPESESDGEPECESESESDDEPAPEPVKPTAMFIESDEDDIIVEDSGMTYADDEDEVDLATELKATAFVERVTVEDDHDGDADGDASLETGIAEYGASDASEPEISADYIAAADDDDDEDDVYEEIDELKEIDDLISLSEESLLDDVTALEGDPSDVVSGDDSDDKPVSKPDDNN